MQRPKLTKIPGRTAFGKAVDQLNRAVSDQANIRPGNGLGVSVSPSGRLISLNAPILQYAKATSDGVPPAEDLDNGERRFGSGKVYTASLKYDDGDYVISPNADNPIEVLNLSLSPVEPDAWLMIAKILNVWQVVWEDCPQSSE